MCNAWNHSPSCNCGWGGNGYAGNGNSSSPNVGNFTETRIGYQSSGTSFGNTNMRDLAARLGHSLIFPVTCRYCGADIYLFASPNGGFAVFDHLGIPWPKHWCSKCIESKTLSCNFPEFHQSLYALSKSTTSFLSSRIGQRIAGIVLNAIKYPHPRRKDIWTIDVYECILIQPTYSMPSKRCRKGIHRLKIDIEYKIGSHISGEITQLADVGTFLFGSKQHLPPGYAELE